MEEDHSALGMVELEPKQALQGTQAARHCKAEEDMTPVQLPEVPEPAAWAMTDYQPEANTQFTMRADAAEHYASVGLQVEPLYTAAQLREYATEAVRLNAIPSVFIEQMEMLREDFQRFANGDPKVPFVVVRDALVQALNEWDEITPPEQNSER